MKTLGALAFFCRLRLCAVKCAADMPKKAEISQRAPSSADRHSSLETSCQKPLLSVRFAATIAKGVVKEGRPFADDITRNSSAHFSAIIARSAVTEVHP